MRAAPSEAHRVTWLSPLPQGLLRVESAKTHVLEGGLLPSILASAAMPVPLVRSLVITPATSPPMTRTSSKTHAHTNSE